MYICIFVNSIMVIIITIIVYIYIYIYILRKSGVTRVQSMFAIAVSEVCSEMAAHNLPTKIIPTKIA